MQKLDDGKSFLQNEKTAKDLLKSATSLEVKYPDGKIDLEQKQSVSSLIYGMPPMKERQKDMPKEVIDEFRDTCVIPWRESHGNDDGKRKDRGMLHDKLDEMLFEARYYSVRIGDIQLLSKGELEKLFRFDISQIPSAAEMGSETVRLELVQQAIKVRRLDLRQKVWNLLRDPDQTNARQNAYNQKQRDDPKGMIQMKIREVKKRCKRRRHPFNLMEVLPHLIDALLGVEFDADGIGRCGCKGNHKPCHNGKVQLMANGGGYGFSFDRLDDNRGYNQPLVVVCGMCNKQVKPDSIPKLRNRIEPVISRIANDQVTRTVKRMKVLLKKKNPSEEESKHLDRWQQVYDSGESGSKGRKKLWGEYRATVAAKYNQIRNGDGYCPHCTDQDGRPIKMDVGTNEKTPKFTHNENPRQISPDRINDSNPYYDANNWDFCCLACQPCGREVSNVEAELIPFTREKRNQMVQYLRDLLSGKEQWPAMMR